MATPSAPGPRSFSSDGRAYVGFSLASINPPVAIAGSYTLTITADSTCAALPDDVRTRTYPATVRGRHLVDGSRQHPIQRQGDRRAVRAFFKRLLVGVFGDYVNISTEGEGPSLVEHVGPNRYVAFYGGAGRRWDLAASDAISVPFAGTVEYCELASPIGQYYDCSATVCGRAPRMPVDPPSTDADAPLKAVRLVR